MKSKIGVTLFIIGFFLAVIGVCSLDSDVWYTQITIITMIGFASMGIGATILQIFD